MSEAVTRAEKLACAKRELAMRRSVYPNWVSRGKMTQPEADREIRVMEAIVADYAPEVTPDLFAATTTGAPPQARLEKLEALADAVKERQEAINRGNRLEMAGADGHLSRRLAELKDEEGRVAKGGQ